MELLQNLDGLHTTELGEVRIKKNLSLVTDDVIAWCREKISSPDAVITRRGKNWYIDSDGCIFTVNAQSMTIITAHRKKKNTVSESSDIFSRTQLLFGEEAMKILADSRVAVFGIGGVGGYTVEALARSGVGAIDLIDDDRVCSTNINRQVIALNSTVGMYKVNAAAERIRDINPECRVTAHRMFYMPETSDMLDFSQFDYVVDAIDTVTGKLEIIEQAKKAGVPVISSMGAGNKLDPTAFEVSDIYKTSVCPLAKVMRYQLKRRGIKKLKVVYSKEQPIVPQGYPTDDGSGQTDMRKGSSRRSIPASVAFVPSVVGIIIAGEVIKDLIGFNSK